MAQRENVAVTSRLPGSYHRVEELDVAVIEQALPAAPSIRIERQWWVLVALAVMVAAITSGSFWFLNWVHVFSGLLWTGTDLFMGFMIGPILRIVAPATRRDVILNLIPRMLFYMPTLAIVTGTSGWYLANQMGFASVGFPSRYWMYAAYGLAALMTLDGVGLLLPTNLRIYFELRKAQPDFARVSRLTGFYVRLTMIQGLMQVGIIVIMAKLATGF